MVYCVVPYCNSNTRKEKFSFHEIPNHCDLRQKWLRAISRQGTFIMKSVNHSKNFGSFSVLCAKIVDWREKNGLPRHGNEYGPLTDLPDWSYADGRPAPLLKGQKRRLLKQQEYCQKIVQLLKEMDDAVELKEAKDKEEEEKINEVVSNRLKAKGDSYQKRIAE